VFADNPPSTKPGQSDMKIRKGALIAVGLLVALGVPMSAHAAVPGKGRGIRRARVAKPVLRRQTTHQRRRALRESRRLRRITASSVRDSHIWDGWITVDRSTGLFHRFNLAAPKSAGLQSLGGNPSQRDRQAYIRYFTSKDGHTWKDHGSTGIAGWSGSAVFNERGRFLFFTEKNMSHQRIRLAIWDGAAFRPLPTSILDPEALAARARKLGYHLGNGDGLIMAWRDPFVYRANGEWHMLFAAKRRLASGKIVPTVGHAVSLDPDFQKWKLEKPMNKIPDIGGNHLNGQIELPTVARHGGKTYLFMSHSIVGAGKATRTTRAYTIDESGKLTPVNRNGGVIIGPASGVYGFNLVADPSRPGELLAHGFYDVGHKDQMRPTPMTPVVWKNGEPTVEFRGVADLADAH